VNLATLKTILIDGDGVIWRANEAVPGALDFFDLLKQRDMDWALLTNNNSHVQGLGELAAALQAA